VGLTPLVLDNIYPDGPVEVEVALRGFHPWKGTFQGGEAAKLHPNLKRR
jgi:serine/threonine-protein kinase